jgi:CotH kinase protein/Lamin Tail Domain
MDPDIVNHTNPAIGGAAQVKAALEAISTVCITTDLPNLFNINGSQGIIANPGSRGFAWERPCSMEMINPPSAGFPNGTSEFQVGAGIRIRGGYSRSTSNPKHAFHFYFREDYGATKLVYPFFGRHGTDEFDQVDLRTTQNYSWSFDNGSANNTFMREESTRLAQIAMGHQSGRLRYLHLYINGIYWGLFETEERTEASFSATYYGGSKDDYDVVKNAGNANNYLTEVTDGDFTAWQDLWNKGRTHKTNPTNANYFAMQGLAADGVTPTASPVLLDVNSIIDYMLLTFYTGNLDGSTSAFLGNHTSNNWFASRNRLGTKGGFRFFAHDFEHSLFNTAEDRTGPYTGVNDANFSHSSPMFLHQDLSTNPEFRMRWADRVHKHMFNGGALTNAAWTARWSSMAAIVDSAIIAESARWGDSKIATPRTRNDWIAAKNSLMNYSGVRHANVIAQLRGDNLYPTLDAPGMAPFGGYVLNGAEIVMTNNGGTIYYMADGSDPRAVGGAVRAGALVYTSSTTNDALVALGSSWRYLGDGSNQGTAWKETGFNDAAWSSGNAELGYGDGDEATTVPFVDADSVAAGVQKNATTYFRRTFSAANIAGITALNLNIEYDDAAVVYINGTAVANTPNISAGAAYNYYSGAAVDDLVASFPINPAVLVGGTNTIAVEVHQANSGSSDVSFNLSLTATRTTSGTPYNITGAGARPFKVRAYNAGTWSALLDATFLVDTEAASAANLVISEIMYHPATPTPAEAAAGFGNPDDFEYVELTNIGVKHVDLFDVYFYGAIDFNFSDSLLGRTLAPGARLIIAAKKSAFELRYGAGKPVAGSYKGNLGNGGETVQLFFPNDTILRSVSYTDSAPWPEEADGGGHSLVLKRPATNPDHALPGNWRVSAQPGGAPGEADSNTLGAFNTAHSISDPGADNDKDTLTNLQEYALGGNPNANSQAQQPVLGESGGYATLSFTRPTANDDIAYAVEGTGEITNAASWSAANAVLMSATRNPNGTTTEVHRSSQLITGAAKQYLRLKTTLLP